MSRSRYTLAFDHNNMVPAPDGKASPQTIFKDEDGIMLAYGTTVPSGSASGYEIGCIFIHTDGNAKDTIYVNEGSETSCDFNAVTTAYASAVSSAMIANGAIVTAKIADSAVTEAEIADSAVTEAKLGNAVADGITTGALAAKVIASAELELLLDTSENDLFAVKAGDEILAVKLIVQAAAGNACTVTVGTDAAVDGTTKDVDSLLKAGDANATGIQSSDDVAGTYLGDDLAFGSFTVQGDGNITISASSDQHDSSFVGKIVMIYIPA